MEPCLTYMFATNRGRFSTGFGLLACRRPARCAADQALPVLAWFRGSTTEELNPLVLQWTQMNPQRGAPHSVHKIMNNTTSLIGTDTRPCSTILIVVGHFSLSLVTPLITPFPIFHSPFLFSGVSFPQSDPDRANKDRAKTCHSINTTSVSKTPT